MKINGETQYLWRAVDHEGEVLESYVTKTRDKSAAFGPYRGVFPLVLIHRIKTSAWRTGCEVLKKAMKR